MSDLFHLSYDIAFAHVRWLRSNDDRRPREVVFDLGIRPDEPVVGWDDVVALVAREWHRAQRILRHQPYIES